MSYFCARRESPAIEDAHRSSLLASWRRPQARVAEGVCLGDSGLATSCQDTSDGLKAAIESIAAASRVGVMVDEAKLPVAPEVTAVCKHLGLSPLSLVFGDSVDFELVFSLPQTGLATLDRLFTDRGLAFFVIGEVTPGNNVLLRHRDGSVGPLPGVPWRHGPDSQNVSDVSAQA